MDSIEGDVIYVQPGPDRLPSWSPVRPPKQEVPVLRFIIAAEGIEIPVIYKGSTPGIITVNQRVAIKGRYVRGNLVAFSIHNLTTRSMVTPGGCLHCFIATAAYGSPHSAQVRFFRSFRDNYLLQRPGGVRLVKLYEALSPALAKRIANRNWTRRICRDLILKPSAGFIKLFFTVPAADHGEPHRD